ncbi:hypothetical protein F4803DRAFT_341135 [Xylaria telfairii]|nr:hypothetical protein F4803DRAFT_341135 [Xylaria telfairii]
MASNHWDRHKTTIIHLFLLERMQYGQIASYMKEKHEFDRSESAYEKQLRKWGVRKNLRRKDWEYIGHHINKRERKNKKSEVFYFGTLLPAPKVHKETQRYADIPSAREYGKIPLSPETPSGAIIRIQTPPAIELEVAWPTTLPWFDFKNRVLSILRPSETFLKAFFATSSRYKPSDRIHTPIMNPLEFRQAVLRLTSAVPDDPQDRPQKTGALAQNEFPPSSVAEMLEALFFHLSNNIELLGDQSTYDQSTYDRFVLHLVEAISSTNPEILERLLCNECTTTEAIKEVVYKSAVRERNYSLVEQLVKSGVDPNLPVTYVTSLSCHFQLGIVRLIWFLGLDKRVTGMLIAALARDTRLAKILLSAGADIKESADLLMQAAICSDKQYHVHSSSDGQEVVEFMRLLFKHGAIVKCHKKCSCGGTRASLLFAIAIHNPNDLLSEALAETGATADLSGCSGAEECCCGRNRWDSRAFRLLGIPYTLLHLAAVFKNHEIFDLLFAPVYSSPRNYLPVIKQLLLISCLVGDYVTASKLLSFRFDLNYGWKLGITPLIATAWNQDTRIAEKLLGLGASVGPTVQDKATLIPGVYPIHVATYHNNTKFVRRLLDAGATCEVRYNHSVDYTWLRKDDEPLPPGTDFPIQFALCNKDVDTIRLLLPSSNLHGGEYTQASHIDDLALISDVIAKQKSILSGNENGIVILEDIITAKDPELVKLYFSSGMAYKSDALLSATKSAITSGDPSRVRLLARYRPAGVIDTYEASSLVYSIVKRQWDLVDILLSDPFHPGPSQSFPDIDGIQTECPPLFKFPYSRSTRVTPLSAGLCSGNISVVQQMVQRGYKITSTDALFLFLDGELETPNIPNAIRTIVGSTFPQAHMNPECWEAVLIHGIQSGDVTKVREYSKMVRSFDFETNIMYFNIEEVMYYRVFPLGLAAKNGNVELVGVLFHAGANLNYSPDNGYTALQVAVSEGHIDVVKFLIDNKAVIDPPRLLKTKATALQLAAGKGHLSIVRMLIEAGADRNAPPALRHGRTALETAAENGRLDTVQFLLERGVELEGEMRIYYVRSVGFAMREGHYVIANQLKQHGSWSERDQRLCSRRYALHPAAYFRYNEELVDWYIRVAKWSYLFFYEPASDIPSSDGFLGEEFFSDEESTSEEESILNEGSNFGNEMEGTDEIVNLNYTPRTWQNDMALTHPKPTHLTFSSEEGTSYAPTAAWTLGSDRVTELEDITLTDDVAQQSTLLDTREPNLDVSTGTTGYGVANTRVEENYAVDQMEICRPVLGSRQEMLDSDMPNPDALYVDVTDLPTGFFDMNMGWEGPSTSTSGFS